MPNSNSAKIENLVALKYKGRVEETEIRPVSELKCKGLEIDLEKGEWSYTHYRNIPIGSYSGCFRNPDNIMIVYDITDDKQLKTAQTIQKRFAHRSL